MKNNYACHYWSLRRPDGKNTRRVVEIDAQLTDHAKRTSEEENQKRRKQHEKQCGWADYVHSEVDTELIENFSGQLQLFRFVKAGVYNPRNSRIVQYLQFNRIIESTKWLT